MQNPQALFGFLAIIITVLIVGAVVYVVSRTYRSGSGRSCYQFVDIDPGTGLCKNIVACYGTNDCLHPSQLLTPPGRTGCNSQMARTYTWRALQKGSLLITRTCTGYQTLALPVGGCTCS